MRLIDADALWMDVIHSMDYCDDILEFIERQPTIEPERKKGKWIIHEGQDELCADMICSSCNKRYQVAEISAADIAKKFKFCPSCGADMRGGKDEQA